MWGGGRAEALMGVLLGGGNIAKVERAANCKDVHFFLVAVWAYYFGWYYYFLFIFLADKSSCELLWQVILTIFVPLFVEIEVFLSYLCYIATFIFDIVEVTCHPVKKRLVSLKKPHRFLPNV